MAVYKIFAEADTTLYSSQPKDNAGLDEILEVGVLNAGIPNVALQAQSADDIRRSLIQFSNSDISKLDSLSSGSNRAAYLRVYFATADNLSTPYIIQAFPVSQSWTMGTGKFLDYPPIRDGACWHSSTAYMGTNNWTPSNYLYTIGGGSWYGSGVSQSFGYKDDKDLNVNVTNIVQYWINSGSNYGFLLKMTSSVEFNTGSYTRVKYFSVDTHTIYPPTLEMRWDDSSYNTGSLSVVNNNQVTVTLANNTPVFKNDTAKYTIRVNARDTYPTRQFTTSSVYLVNKALPSSSYWAIQDAKTEEMVIDFDTTYTKLSCDSNGNYFNLYMNGLEPERYYKVLIKVNLPDGQSIDIDNNNTFKIVR
jgi:hypothetical protein